MAQAQQVHHRDKCRADLRGIHSGFVEERGLEFLETYKIDRNQFDIECLGCCYDFLVAQRNYKPFTGIERVQFSDTNVNVSCYVRKSLSPKAANGQIVTENDPDLITRGFNPTVRVISGGRTYQLYNDTGRMAIGTSNFTRIERLAIDKANKDLLAGVCMNYSDAALMELYRIKRGLDSMEGMCMLKSYEVRSESRESESRRELELKMESLNLAEEAPQCKKQ